jgi:hypothetical protein
VKRQKSIKAVLAGLKIEMGHPHITASTRVALYPEQKDSLKLMRIPLNLRSNMDRKLLRRLLS